MLYAAALKRSIISGTITICGLPLCLSVCFLGPRLSRFRSVTPSLVQPLRLPQSVGTVTSSRRRSWNDVFLVFAWQFCDSRDCHYNSIHVLLIRHTWTCAYSRVVYQTVVHENFAKWNLLDIVQFVLAIIAAEHLWYCNLFVVPFWQVFLSGTKTNK